MMQENIYSTKIKRKQELKKAMDDYIKSLADHPRISLTGMMYYGNISNEYNKLVEELDKVSNKTTQTVRPSRSRKKEIIKPILNENESQSQSQTKGTRMTLRKRKDINYKE